MGYFLLSGNMESIDGSWISQMVGANPEGRIAKLLFGPKNAWKWKKFDR